MESKDIEETKKLLKKEKKPAVLKAGNFIFNRKILDYGKFNLLVFPSEDNSGINHILAKAAEKKGISIGFDIQSLKYSNKKKKSIIIAELIQIIKLCRKNHAKMKLINIKDRKNAFAFLLSLGASTSQAKEAISF
ncbi:MAG: hypothetical protein AABW65_02335 [Nanoarchaeota archaeon]